MDSTNTKFILTLKGATKASKLSIILIRVLPSTNKNTKFLYKNVRQLQLDRALTFFLGLSNGDKFNN